MCVCTYAQLITRLDVCSILDSILLYCQLIHIFYYFFIMLSIYLLLISVGYALRILEGLFNYIFIIN